MAISQKLKVPWICPYLRRQISSTADSRRWQKPTVGVERRSDELLKLGFRASPEMVIGLGVWIASTDGVSMECSSPLSSSLLIANSCRQHSVALWVAGRRVSHGEDHGPKIVACRRAAENRVHALRRSRDARKGGNFRESTEARYGTDLFYEDFC